MTEFTESEHDTIRLGAFGAIALVSQGRPLVFRPSRSRWPDPRPRRRPRVRAGDLLRGGASSRPAAPRSRSTPRSWTPAPGDGAARCQKDRQRGRLSRGHPGGERCRRQRLEGRQRREERAVIADRGRPDRCRPRAGRCWADGGRRAAAGRFAGVTAGQSSTGSPDVLTQEPGAGPLAAADRRPRRPCRSRGFAAVLFDRTARLSTPRPRSSAVGRRGPAPTG